MKTKYFLLLPAVLFCVFAIAAPKDNETIPKPDNVATPGYNLDLLPGLNALYFNQVIDFSLPPASASVIDHVEFGRGTSQILPRGFRLTINYANRKTAFEDLKVYVRDAAGKVTLGYSKKITLEQKLGEWGGKTVADHDDLFKLDGTLQSLENYFTKDKLLKAQVLEISAERFNPAGIHLKSFDMLITTAKGLTMLHAEDGNITAEMKAAIQSLQDGDVVGFTNVVSEYVVNNQKVQMGINYTLKYTIGSEG
ncbi:MAG: hypothetical protein JWO06_3825 [Bacteroidota bacterium]|nr:hypothetical protein [Bacteroidota bacterium]